METNYKAVPENIRNLAQKLQALAQQGVGGEADNAREKLNILCEKYGISPESLEEERTFRWEFKASFRRLFCQVFVSQFGTTEKYMNSRLYNNAFEVELTYAEYIAFDALWNWHKKNFAVERRKMRKLMERAYYEGYSLFAKETCEAWEQSMAHKGKPEKMGLDEMLAIQQMAGMVNGNKYHKQIGE